MEMTIQSNFYHSKQIGAPSYVEDFDALYYVRIAEDSTIENSEWEIED